MTLKFFCFSWLKLLFLLSLLPRIALFGFSAHRSENKKQLNPLLVFVFNGLPLGVFLLLFAFPNKSLFPTFTGMNAIFYLAGFLCGVPVFLSLFSLQKENLRNKRDALQFFCFAGLLGLWFLLESWSGSPTGLQLHQHTQMKIQWLSFFNHPFVLQKLFYFASFLFLAGISFYSFYAPLKSNSSTNTQKKILVLAILLFLSSSFFGFRVIGKSQPSTVAHWLPLHKTSSFASLPFFGIQGKGWVSWWIYASPKARVLGLEEFPLGDRPSFPFLPIFFQFRLLLSFVLLALGMLLLVKKNIQRTNIVVFFLATSLFLVDWTLLQGGKYPWLLYFRLRFREESFHSSEWILGGSFLLLVMFFVCLHSFSRSEKS